jgi:hypothetical protein
VKLNRLIILVVLLFCFMLPLSAQDDSTDLIESDLDSLFDDVFEEDTLEKESELDSDIKTTNEQVASVLEDLATKTGFTFIAKYAFVAGLAPGWDEAPWYMDRYNPSYSNVVGADIGSDFTLDFQLSPAFRVKQVYRFRFPDFQADVEEFWGTYNLLDVVYFKMGKQKVKWGLGRNYNYTNLTTRIPVDLDTAAGDTYAFQANKPIGIGGLEFLTLVRSGFVESGVENITASDMAYGLKYNYASQLMDLNWGTLYHSDMDLRSFVSLESTINNRVEVYAEGLISVDQNSFDDFKYSASFGFYDDFFNKRLSINAEYYYNGEETISYVDEDQGLIEVEVSPYIFGHNMALNLGYKPMKSSSLRFFFQGMYNANENTGKLLPGLRIKPLDSISLYLAVPIAVGDRNGTYYTSNYDDDNRPFSITMAVRLDGQFKMSRYK